MLLNQSPLLVGRIIVHYLFFNELFFGLKITAAFSSSNDKMKLRPAVPCLAALPDISLPPTHPEP
jgi:hypothetical protein